MQVELQNVSVEYPVRKNGRFDSASNWAIRDLSLSLAGGDRLGVSGGNGSGKSTLLRVISGVQPATQGQVNLTGRVSSLLTISSIFHAKATGKENILFRGKLMKIGAAQLSEALDYAENHLGLGGAINQPLETYSSGMKMKLSFSLATSFQADILVMDEWISVGDSVFQETANERLNKSIDGTGIFVLASHSEQTLNRLTNRRLSLD